MSCPSRSLRSIEARRGSSVSVSRSWSSRVLSRDSNGLEQIQQIQLIQQILSRYSADTKIQDEEDITMIYNKIT